MDGVLIDSENYWQETERAIFRELGIELTDELLVQTRGLRTEEMVAHWSNRFNLNGAKPEILMQRHDELMEETMKREVPLMDGAKETIRFFLDKGLPVALASCSSEAHIDAAMERHGLKGFFTLKVSAAEKMQGKPHPEVYLHTAALLETDPVCCLAIEDSFYGVIAAKAARMKVVALPDPAEYNQERFGAADLKISSLYEINDQSFQMLEAL